MSVVIKPPVNFYRSSMPPSYYSFCFCVTIAEFLLINHYYYIIKADQSKNGKSTLIGARLELEDASVYTGTLVVIVIPLCSLTQSFIALYVQVVVFGISCKE